MFTVKLQNWPNGTFCVSGYVINPLGQIVQVLHNVETFDDARFILNFYSDENDFECRRIIELSEHPKLDNSNLRNIRNFIFG